MGITPETKLPEGILTPAKAKSIRFTQSKPGYHFVEVEEFVEQVQLALTTYAKLLHERDLNIHDLDHELGRAQVDLRNKNSELEVYVAKQGIVQANVDDSEISVLLESNQDLLQKLNKAEAEKLELQNTLNELNAWAEEAEQHINTLESEKNQQVPLAQQTIPEPIRQPQTPYTPNGVNQFPGIRPEDLE